MLRTRVITAIVLLAVLLPALFAASPWPFAMLTLVMIGAGGWEWAKLNGLARVPSLAFGGLIAAACGGTLLALGLAAPPAWCWWIAGALWVLGGAQALRSGVAGWPKIALALRLVLGAVALWAAWLAIAQAKAQGINFILSIFCLVWMADVAAYFGGRTMGKRKLAPAISPGKSWEGVWTGMAGVLLLSVLWTGVIEPRLSIDSPSLFQLLQRQGWLVNLLALIFLAAMSVVGDLFESLIKRAVGAKDSSQLLPGHGGVLDRVDALLPVFPLALALSSL
ncbi:phosphatidate cytidylyltransferase [Pelomonas sp. SE-A7]|uniref:phosphatidate cytidylyltransferase n=1 Tax=Pelomonas sp. SE-A7 TaxID=3054953 RepID=UPI00259CF575|nr:phosphatidate cytidylyltransferase [Pelomonas sp. SE-A7]MDM4767368.1 phosphatidate cytidylyltransferase [Pelomonas sp. SE-A7]